MSNARTTRITPTHARYCFNVSEMAEEIERLDPFQRQGRPCWMPELDFSSEGPLAEAFRARFGTD